MSKVVVKTATVSFPAPILDEVLHPFPKDFVIVTSLDDPKILDLILQNPDFPENTEVVTSELSAFPWKQVCRRKGKERDSLLGFLERGNAVRPGMLYAAREKGLSVWLGAPLADEEDTMHNGYVFFEKGEESFAHAKYYLYNKKGVFMEENVFDKPLKYDGHYHGRTILICHELQGFYDPVWKTCRLPEARSADSRLLMVPAVWTANKKDVLRKLAMTVVRRVSEPIDKSCALHPKGSVALVADDNWAGVFGAVSKGRQKGASLAEIHGAGWIHISRSRREIRTVEVK